MALVVDSTTKLADQIFLNFDLVMWPAEGISLGNWSAKFSAVIKFNN